MNFLYNRLCLLHSLYISTILDKKKSSILYQPPYDGSNVEHSEMNLHKWVAQLFIPLLLFLFFLFSSSLHKSWVLFIRILCLEKPLELPDWNLPWKRESQLANTLKVFCLFTFLVCRIIKSPHLTPKSWVGSKLERIRYWKYYL